MRGEDERSGSLFSHVDLEARVGKDHPPRTIRGVVNEALASLRASFRRSLPEWVAPRFCPKSCCGRCCCRCSTRSARSGS
jgi:hypothetical protein